MNCCNNEIYTRFTTNTVSGPAAADTLTFTGQPADGEVVVLNGKTYTFQDTLTDVDGNVQIGATAAISIDNLFVAVNLGDGAGTLYALAMTAPTSVLATAETDTTIVITTKGIFGATADAIAVSTDISNATWGDGDADQTLILLTVSDDYFVFGKNGVGVNVVESATGLTVSVVPGSVKYVTVRQVDKVIMTPPSGGAIVVYDRFGGSKTYAVDAVVTLEGDVHGYVVQLITVWGVIEIEIIEEFGTPVVVPLITTA